MDISLVRQKFQKAWDFSIPTNYLGDVTHWLYSLQEESLNSRDKLLYITSETKPLLEGHLLLKDEMYWIVWKAMQEHFNESLWQFLLLPCLDTIEVQTVPVARNAMGIVVTTDERTTIELHTYLEDYGLKERTVPTKQPVESFQNVFYIAKNELPSTEELYELFYHGVKYKIDSIEHIVGAYKIRATEDL